MRLRQTLLLCPLLLALPALAQQGEENTLYRCRGDDGVTSYQQRPCGAGQLDAGRIAYDPNEALQRAPSPPASPPPPPPAAPAAPVAAPPPEAIPPAEAAATGNPPLPGSTTPAVEALPPAPPPSPAFQANEPPSDAVECLRPDSSTYIRSGECERSEIGGGTIEGYVIDEETGARVWTETAVPLRSIQDPARALTRLEACELARLHIAQIKDGKSPGGNYLRDAERVRDRHCD